MVNGSEQLFYIERYCTPTFQPHKRPPRKSLLLNIFNATVTAAMENPFDHHACLAKLQSHLSGRLGMSFLVFLVGGPPYLVLMTHIPAHEFEYEHLLHWLFRDSPLSKAALESHVRAPILSAFPVTGTLVLAVLYAFCRFLTFVALLRNPKLTHLAGNSFGFLIGSLDPWFPVRKFAIAALRFDVAVLPYRLAARVLWLAQNCLMPGLFKVDTPQLAVAAQGLYNRVLGILRRREDELNLPRYKYRPLRYREIRLLRVSRWFPLKRVQVSVEHVFLGTHRSYEAISYTWGDQTLPRQEILIDGCSLSIPYGAYHAIMGRASFFRTRTIWLDAVCIDQDGDSEKYRQLPMMREIYQLASRVVVWLGQAKSSSDAILAVMSLFYTSQEHKGPDLYAKYTYPSSRQNWRGLVELLNHQWFHRSWIIQEVTVPSEVHVVYGGHYISFDVLISVISLFFELDMASLLLKSSQDLHALQNSTLGIRNARMIWQIQTKIRKGEALPWSQLLSDCMDFQATMPEDKIYSLQNLTTEPLPPSLLPDPEQPRKAPRDVYVETARSLLGPSYLTHIFPFAGVGWRYRPSKLLPSEPSHQHNVWGDQELPSWVPDWSAIMSRQLICLLEEETPYLASGTLKAPTPILIGKGKDKLVLSTVPIDKILTLGNFHDLDIRSSSLSSAEIETVKNDLYQETLSLIAQLNPPPVPEHDIWRFLIGDWADGKRPASAEYADHYAAFQASLNRDPKHSYATEILPFLYHYFKQGKEINSPEAFLVHWRVLKDEEKLLFLGPCTEAEFTALLPELIVQSSVLEEKDVLLLLQRKKKRDIQINEYLSHMSRMMDGRRFCVTREGRIGFVPPGTREGDRVVLVADARTPFVVRDVTGSGSVVRLVGECYVHGVMDGEMMTDGVEWKLITLV